MKPLIKYRGRKTREIPMNRKKFEELKSKTPDLRVEDEKDLLNSQILSKRQVFCCELLSKKDLLNLK
jgi:hypothetical protein